MRKFYGKFLLFSRAKQIAYVVCGLHLLVLVSLFGHHLFTTRQRAPRPIAVRTVVQAPVKPETGKVQTVVATAPQQQSQKKATAAKPAPVVKKEAPKKALPTVSNAAVKPKVVAEKKEEKMLYEIAARFEALAKEEKAGQKSSALAVPSKIESKKATVIAAAADEKGPTYGEFLIGFLQNTLDLPEFGEVKLKIEIDRFGALLSCEVLEAKSTKNGEFLKNRLPELTFPCLNDFDITDAKKTFTITFRNVEVR